MFKFCSTLYVVALLLLLLPLEGVSEVGRTVLMISVLPGVLIPKYGIMRKEFHFLCFASIILTATAISVFFANDPDEALMDLLRQSFILSFAFLFVLSLRIAEMRKNIYKGMYWFSMLGACAIFVTYIFASTSPLQFLTDSKGVKFRAQYDLGISLNPLSFAVFLAYIASYAEWQKSALRKYGSTGFQLICLMLAGSRTTMLTAALFFTVTKIDFKKIFRFRVPLGFTTILALVAFASALSDINSFNLLVYLNDLTTGRAGLWSAALTKFMERPLTGWGAMSWHTDLNRFIPSFTNMNYDLLESGAFHNSFLTVLAEKGLIVFVPYAIFSAYFLKLSLTLAQNRKNFYPSDNKFAAVAPYLVLLMLFRAMGEQPGLFGYANGLVDFISYSIVAVILAVATANSLPPQLEVVSETDKS